MCWAGLDRQPDQGAGAGGRFSKALQGNLDPNVLFASPQQIEAEVVKVLNAFGTPHTGSWRRTDPYLQPGSRHQPAHTA
jgi:uroporphyrinogen-III decarboxylase